MHLHLPGTRVSELSGVEFASLAMQVRDNILQGEQDGLLLAATVSAPPFIYADNNNFRFINNSIDGSQWSPLAMSSAAGVVVQDTRFINVMCR